MGRSEAVPTTKWKQQKEDYRGPGRSYKYLTSDPWPQIDKILE